MLDIDGKIILYNQHSNIFQYKCVLFHETREKRTIFHFERFTFAGFLDRFLLLRKKKKTPI